MKGIVPYLSLLCLLLTVGCASKSRNPEYEKLNQIENHVKSKMDATRPISLDAIPQFEDQESLMAPGFMFSLSHPTDSKLQGRFRANTEGLLVLPYGVRINVTGLTFQQLKNQVQKSYASFFQRGAENVNFRLELREYWIEVRGLVKKPGRYLVARKESLDKVIDLAGGLIGSIKQDFYILTLKQSKMSYTVSLNQYYEESALGPSFTWTGGDVLFVNTSTDAADLDATVEVLGGVANPGKTLYQEDYNIFHYLAKRGGTLPNLGYEEVFLIRKGDKGLERIRFDLTEMDQIPVIKPGDTLFLTADRRTVTDKIWERASQISGFLATIAIFIIAL